MKKLITFIIKYPIWVSVIMFSVSIFGIISLSQIRYSFFPETNPKTIIIDVNYPGASPEEIEEGVVLKIEENIEGVVGVDRITSVSKENIGSITVEIELDADIDKVLTDVKNAVDRINSFPVNIEEPIIYKRSFRMLSQTMGIYGETDLYNLKYLAEVFRDDLLETGEISQVEITGLPSLEFSIEVSESDMRRYQLTFNDIKNAVANFNVNISGGKIDTKDEEILIRAWGRGYQANDLLDIPIRGNSEGTAVLLRDVATVNEQWEDSPNRIYYNGSPAVVISINQTENEDILNIAEVSQKVMDKFNEEHDGVEAVIIRDSTIPLVQRIELLVKNGLIGLLLVLLCLGFFLNLRLSFWVAVSIPFSFAGMFIIASFSGLTINVLSLAGMIIVVGILVDDAIVVGENIFSHYERGKPALRAAIDGTLEVVKPVFASVITTVIVFTTFFFIQGELGEMFWQMGLVVIASLLFSLVEAFTILPSHLAHSKGLSRDQKVSKVREKFESIINFISQKLYAPVLRFAINYKWLITLTPVAMIMITIGLIRGGLIGITFFPHVDGDIVPINVSMVAGRQEADIDKVLQFIETKCWEVNEEIKSERADGADVIETVQRTIGQSSLGQGGSHTGNLMVALLDGEHRDMESYLIANRIRKAVGQLPEVDQITYGENSRFGKAVSVSLQGYDVNQLEKATTLMKSELEQFVSLQDVTDTNEKGRREIDIKLKPLAHSLGLTLQDIAGQVRQGFYGQEIQRIQRGRDEIKVWVRYRPEDRSSLHQIDKLRIRTASGAEYPFSELASYTIDRGTTQISHLDRKREIKVEANQSDVSEDLPPILEEIELNVIPKVLQEVSGVTAQFEGQSREETKMKNSMIIAFSVAFLGMFILVILVFRSYAQAFIVFSLIPLGFIGAIWGHGIQGIQLNLLSMIGLMALSGIIINDSIVFVDQFNRNMRDGQRLDEAVFNTGISRLRPILLTTLTTALGMAPLILETSRQAKFLIPMAVSVAYGLVFGTFILLVILPSLILVFNTVRVKYAHWFVDKSLTREDVEPAVQETKDPLLSEKIEEIENA